MLFRLAKRRRNGEMKQRTNETQRIDGTQILYITEWEAAEVAEAAEEEIEECISTGLTNSKKDNRDTLSIKEKLQQHNNSKLRNEMWVVKWPGGGGVGDRGGTCCGYVVDKQQQNDLVSTFWTFR